MLSAILNQNPQLMASFSSPVANLFDGLLKGMGANSEYYCSIDNNTRSNVLFGIFESYYINKPNKIVFDTNRYWCSVVPVLQSLLPGCKIICCVRPIPYILNSFELLFQKNPLVISRMFKPGEGKTVYQRVEALMSSSGTVGFSFDAFKEAYYGQHRKSLIIIDYDEFVLDPAQTMWRIYKELGIKQFDHDFDNFQMSGGEFDRQLGLPGLHDVKGPVRIMDEQMVLPPDICQRYNGKTFWK